MRTIKIKINSGEKMCGDCAYKKRFSTGTGEWHMMCEIFAPHYGEWNSLEMKRSNRCIRAERSGSVAPKERASPPKGGK